MLTKSQIDEYNEVGAIVVPNILSAAEVARLRTVTDEFVDRARAVTQHDEIYDLEDHTPPRSRACGGSRHRTRIIRITARL